MTSKPSLESLTAIFRKVFEDDTLTISASTTPEHIPEWDSFNHIILINTIERDFNVRLTGEEVQDTATVGEFLALLQRKVGG